MLLEERRLLPLGGNGTNLLADDCCPRCIFNKYMYFCHTIKGSVQPHREGSGKCRAIFSACMYFPVATQRQHCMSEEIRQHSNWLVRLSIWEASNVKIGHVEYAGENFLFKLYGFHKLVLTLEKFGHPEYNQADLHVLQQSNSNPYHLPVLLQLNIPCVPITKHKPCVAMRLTQLNGVGRYLMDTLVPVKTTKGVTPYDLLSMIACGCKSARPFMGRAVAAGNSDSKYVHPCAATVSGFLSNCLNEMWCCNKIR